MINENTVVNDEINVDEVDTDSAEAVETVEADATNEQGSEEAGQSIEARLKKAESEAAKFRRLFEKATKNKVEAKPAAESTPSVSAPSTPQGSQSVDERVLKAQGMSDELLKQLKDVAKLRGTPDNLIDVQSDPLFATIREQYESDEKAKKASMGASRGSGSVKAKKDFNTPGLTTAERKELFEKTFNSK
jgi:hypothetical protein